MSNKISFSNAINKRMLILSIITGMIITISMPLTYLITLLDNKVGQLLLLVGSSVIGVIIGLVLYRLPAKIILKAEEEITKVFERLNYLSYHDMLTNLPNRLQFNESLKNALINSQQNGQKLAVMFLDLDRFKLINDTLGHNIGDILLQNVANRLKGCIRKNDIAARLGGDEFTIILPKVNNLTEVAIVADKIIKTLTQPFSIEDNEFIITTSMGISIYPADGSDIETLIKNADAAMYYAKEKGSNKYLFYSPDMNTASLERLNLENNLRKALEREEFLIYYQPIMNAANEEMTGVEALVRWNHPEKGILYPEDFMSIAQETGLITYIDEWVFNKACIQIIEWHNRGFPDIYVSLNLSEKTFQQKYLVKKITSILNATGLQGKYVQVEIVEHIAMKDEENIVNKLNSLKALGIRIAIDDFGTGYSSLSRLKKFPLDTLKIDKSFINNITLNTNDLAITTSIINLANSLGINVIAEGVENISQLAILRGYGCNEIQGYYFGKPVLAEEYKKLIILDYSEIM